MRYFKQEVNQDVILYWSLLEPTQENKTDWNLVLEKVSEDLTAEETALYGFKAIKYLVEKGLIELETTFIPIRWSNTKAEVVGNKIQEKIKYTPVGNIIIAESYEKVGECVCLFSEDTFYMNSNYAREIMNQYLLNVNAYEEGEMEITNAGNFLEYAQSVKLEELKDSGIKHKVEFEDGEEWEVKLAPDYSCVIIDGMVITEDGKRWENSEDFINFRNRLTQVKGGGSGVHKLEISPKLEVRFDLSVAEKYFLVKLVGVFNIEKKGEER